MTQLETARKGEISEEMEICAGNEGVTPEFIRKGIEEGTIALVRNNRHTSVSPLAIGERAKDKSQRQYRNVQGSFGSGPGVGKNQSIGSCKSRYDHGFINRW